MTEQELQRIVDALDKIARGGGGSRLGDVPVGDKGEFAKYLKNLSREVDKSRITMGGLTKEMLTGKKRFADLEHTLEDLDEQIEKLGDTVDQSTDETYRALIAKREEVAAAHRNSVAIRGAIDGVKIAGSTIGSVVSTIARGAQGIAKNIINNGDIFTTVADTMDMQLDVHNQVMQGVASTGKMAAGALASLGPAGMIAGAALYGISEALSLYTTLQTETEKFYNRFVLGEGTKLIQAFQKLSGSGAFFAGGMSEMSAAAKDSGLTIKQFSDSIARNSQTLAMAGYGVSDGALKVGSALKAGGAGMKSQLLNLGYTFEEQADLVASTMRDMRQSGGPLRASNAEVAVQTQKYAENLRIISAITGEDAKKKEEQVRQQASQLGFQQKLAGMTEEQRLGITNAMKNMSDLERKNFMDMVNFGTVINQEGAAAAAMSPGLTNAVDAYYRAFRQGTLDDHEARMISRQYTDQQKKDLLDNTAIGLAGAANVGGLAGQIADVMGKELEYRNSWTKEAIDAAEKNVAKQGEASDGLTREIVGAVHAGQQMAVELEQLAIHELPNFGKAIQSTIEYIHEMIGSAKKQSDIAKNPMKHVGEDVASIGKWATIAGGILGIGAVAAAPFTGGASLAALPAAGSMITGGATTWGAGTVMDAVGFAGGGIAHGPSTGHMELLHGTEAVIPLPDGQSIPVALGSSFDDFTHKLDALLKKMESSASSQLQSGSNDPMMAQAFNKMQDLMAKTLGVNEEMANHARDSKDLVQKLLNVSM